MLIIIALLWYSVYFAYGFLQTTDGFAYFYALFSVITGACISLIFTKAYIEGCYMELNAAIERRKARKDCAKAKQMVNETTAQLKR